MANLRYVKDVLAAPRRAPRGATMPDREPTLEPIVGRYVWLTLAGRPHRVYFEEAGRGIPLVCLHTAGADGRQFRHLMVDEAVTRDFRVVALDMPWHGKSLPPAGWQDEEYRLTTGGYVELVVTFCRALGLDRPVVLGCSIGGKIVLQLALEHPGDFRALIGLESAAYQAPWYDDTSWLHRPDVHGGEVCGALMSGLVAPQSPAETRWETLWGYMQSGPGVFAGDLHFYRVEGDFRDRLARIDTARCPLYLLTGEYDFSCTPEDTAWTAARIPGARVTVMREIGHFPMSEHPAQFRRYLLPVLAEIRGV
jgi:pimeloyl-ACP methyl ester carboxylesterase